MKNNSTEPTCELCGQPFQRGTSVDRKEFFICNNNKCPAQRLSRIETRLESIEELLEIKPTVKEEIILISASTRLME